MRSSVPLTGLLALALLAPSALAAQGEGAFVAASPAGLWGGLTFEGADGAVLVHGADDGGAFVLEAPRLLVRVETHRSGDAEDREPEVHEETIVDASATLESGAALALRLGEGTRLALVAGGPAPLRHDEVERMPDATVGLAGSAQPECGRACAMGGGVELLPMAPFTVDGRLEAMLLPGGAIVVQGEGGERRFASERRTETRSSGGVEVPLVGTVGAQEERVEVVTMVTLLAEDGLVRIEPAPQGFAERAGPAPGGPAARPTADEGARGTRVTAPAFDLALQGTLGLRAARGGLTVDGQRHDARHEDLLVGGALRLSFRPAEAQAADDSGMLLLPGGSPPPQDQLQAAIAGDVTSVDVAHRVGADDSTLYQAAAVAGAAGALGLLGLFAPAAKYGLSKIAAVPLYARLERQQLLDNRVRAQLLELVRREPGRSPAELATQMPCAWNTLVYHLSVLEREGYISKAREGRRWRFFPTGAQSHSQLLMLAALQNPRAAALVEQVRASPGVTQHELGERVALSPSTVHWHMDRLLRTGLVRAERDGRVVRYYEGEALRGLGPGAGEASA